MKIIITGKKHETIFEPTPTEFDDLAKRVALTNEIHNRDNPKNPREVIHSDVWPLRVPVA